MILNFKYFVTAIAFYSLSLFNSSSFAYAQKLRALNSEKFRHATIPEDAIADSWIVRLNPPLKDTGVLSAEELDDLAGTYNGKVNRVYHNAIYGMAVNMNENDAQRMSTDPNVAYVEQDSMAYLDQTPTWGLDRVDQRELPLDNSPFNPRNDGSGVTAYVIDTGIRISHNEFNGRASWGENFVDDGNEFDCDGHGTHVAGTIAGGQYGVGDGIEVIAVKVCTCEGSCSLTDIISGIDWVIDDAANKPLAVANMSLGGGFSQTWNDAAGNMHDSGVLTVVSAGNNNENSCGQSPGSEPRVITVGSTTTSDARSSFSNYGSCVDIFAPGSSITSAWIGSDSDINTISGTSMASPHVAGGVALLLANGVVDATAGIIDTASVVDIGNEGAGSPELMLFVGNIAPTISPAPTPTPTACENDFFTVSILTDNYPFETSWILEDTCNGDTVFQRSQGYYGSTGLYVDDFCAMNSSAEYEFKIMDSYGDGICCSNGSGSYSVELNGVEEVSGGSFESEEITTFGSCGSLCEDSPLPVFFQGPKACELIESLGGCSIDVAQSHCPAICNACDAFECMDSMAPWIIFGKVYQCSQLANLPPDDIIDFCKQSPELSATCRGTCGICS